MVKFIKQQYKVPKEGKDLRGLPKRDQDLMSRVSSGHKAACQTGSSSLGSWKSYCLSSQERTHRYDGCGFSDQYCQAEVKNVCSSEVWSDPHMGRWVTIGGEPFVLAGGRA